MIFSLHANNRENPITTQKRHSVSTMLLQDLGMFLPPVEAKGIFFSGFCKTVPLIVPHLQHLSRAAVLKDAVLRELSTRGRSCFTFHSS